MNPEFGVRYTYTDGFVEDEVRDDQDSATSSVQNIRNRKELYPSIAKVEIIRREVSPWSIVPEGEK